MLGLGAGTRVLLSCRECGAHAGRPSTASCVLGVRCESKRAPRGKVALSLLHHTLPLLFLLPYCGRRILKLSYRSNLKLRVS